MAAAIDESKDRLIADLKLILGDAEALLAATEHQTEANVVNLRKRIDSNLALAKSKLKDAEAAIVDKTRVVAQSTDHYVHDHPWQSVGIAAGPEVAIMADDGTLLAFGSYGTFRAFPAFKYSVEHSVYVHPEHQGKGLGQQMLPGDQIRHAASVVVAASVQR